ncbi:hypothetical protein QTH97_14030 [Variovorax sp. J22R24]|uniref:RNA polymerase sigma factor n=1 Tax=Variovorax gracilis TaxID=3053502 RepID=UPI002578DDA0|nr:hypothetical protein [Variovorax sp. J22R24]MDM0106058.1 hypothetical protein [Variovorax sp. J22R24]
MPSMPRDTLRTQEAGLPLAERAEAHLVDRTAHGELRAFEQLYRAYHPRLTRFLDRVTRRPGLVEELLNDACATCCPGSSRRWCARLSGATWQQPTGHCRGRSSRSSERGLCNKSFILHR